MRKPSPTVRATCVERVLIVTTILVLTAVAGCTHTVSDGNATTGTANSTATASTASADTTTSAAASTTEVSSISSVTPSASSTADPTTTPAQTAESTPDTTSRPTGTVTTETTSSPTPPGSTSEPSSTPLSSTTAPDRLMGSDWETIPTDERIVALTFDAGANGDGVRSILDTLDREAVPGTFFLTGRWACSEPDLAREIAAAHRIGNHSVAHPEYTALSDDQIRADVLQAAATIKDVTGRDPAPLFRFPFGDRNQRTIDAVNSVGYVAVRWTVDTLGWKGTSGGISTQTIVDRVTAGLTPGEIVLMHVGSNPEDHSTLDADALPAVIDFLRGRQVSEMLEGVVDVPDTVRATVHHHVVTLTGTVNWHYQREAAHRAVAYLKGVSSVVNSIEIVPKASVANAKSAITAALVRNARLEAKNITVTAVAGGIVRLTGTVNSWTERRQAEHAAWAAQGVVGVDNQLRVVN
jgi:peptidoglycan/xylan/chitin deacetylase (PgdA/CDA1 family)